LLYGGRWNTKESFGAVYVSLSKAVLKAEIVRRMEFTGVTESMYFPRKIVEVRIELSRVVDFRKAEECKKWGLKRADLESDNLKPCQEAAKKVRNAGYEGVVYPSRTGGGDNIAIFTDRLQKHSSVKAAETWTARTLEEID